MFSENQLITRFILGSHADIKPVILSNKSLWGRVSFDEFVRRAQALGDSHRALNGKRTRTGHAMAIWPQGAPAFSQSYQLEDERPEPGQQVLAVGQMPVRDCCSDSPSLANRYDEVFPPGRHEASWSAATRPKRGSAKRPRTEALSRPSVVGAQIPSATRPARPGWVNPSTPHLDVCYACFGIGHRRPLTVSFRFPGTILFSRRGQERH